MKKLLFIVIALVLLGTSCTREVYYDSHTEVIRERDTTSDVIVIEREKEVKEKETQIIIEHQPAPEPKIEPVSDTEFQTVLD